VLAHRFGQGQRLRQTDCRRHGLADQFVETGGADGGQHGGRLGRIGADVAGEKLVALLERGKGKARHAQPSAATLA
jgi:hypothetical protein